VCDAAPGHTSLLLQPLRSLEFSLRKERDGRKTQTTSKWPAAAAEQSHKSQKVPLVHVGEMDCADATATQSESKVRGHVIKDEMLSECTVSKAKQRFLWSAFATSGACSTAADDTKMQLTRFDEFLVFCCQYINAFIYLFLFCSVSERETRREPVIRTYNRTHRREREREKGENGTKMIILP
jgi:hypothetical protein